MSRSLERCINHNTRLDVLCRLVDETLSLTALSARLEKPTAAVAYHLRVLEDRDLIERVADGEDGNALYAANLDGHPPWVAEAVVDHKNPDSDRPDCLATIRAMVGMKCDECERLLRYTQQVVAVYEANGERLARIVTEEWPGTGETENARVAEKYHQACYIGAGEGDPALPPIQD